MKYYVVVGVHGFYDLMVELLVDSDKKDEKNGIYRQAISAFTNGTKNDIIIIIETYGDAKDMELTQIDISEYKSIKQKVSIVFSAGQVVTLIGKNGSGKTNVLEAIKYAMTKNQFYGSEKVKCEIQYHIELTDEEMRDYFSCVQTDERAKEIVVDFDSNNPEKRWVYSSAISIEVNDFKTRLERILLDFKRASQKYINALKKVESDGSFFGGYIDIQMSDENRGSVTRLMKGVIENYERNIALQTEDIKNYLSGIFDGERIVLNRYDLATLSNRFWNIPFYKIPEDEQITISPIVADSLKISKKDLDNANIRLNKKLREINKVLESEYNEMEICLNEFDNIKKEISKIFDGKSDNVYDEQARNHNQFESIIQQLRNIVYNNCYFIDNENSLIFHNFNNREYRNEQIKAQYLNSLNPIVEAFDIFLHNRGILDKAISLTQKDKLSEQQIGKAIKLLNTDFLPSIIPKFDNTEIEKFTVDFSNGSMNLYVQEKNGDIVSFYNTSLGRRWYLTYQFVKAILKPGDMLFIDEPAAFLHPQAQVEFKNELNELSKKGIYLLYSTHSPYMIPEDWGQVYNVTMTEKGTQVDKFDSGDKLCEAIRHELGVTNTANILFNLEKTILLVEGVADKVCIEKFANLLRRNLSNYYIHICDGEAILQVAYMCLKYKMIKVKVILDNDNNYKNENYKRGHSMYSACIKIIKANRKNCIFIGSGEHGCLEDLFVEDSNAKYKHYKNQKGQWKVDIKAVEGLTSIEDVSEQTKKNFEQLFNKLDIPKLDEINS